MIKNLLSILLAVLVLNNVSLAQTETVTKNIPVLEDGAVAKKKISVEYPIYNQAYLRSVQFELTAQPDDKTVLVISGKIENRLVRELINAEVVINLFDKDATAIETLIAEVRPRILGKKEKFGQFSVQSQHGPDIVACKIEITWQGK
ncbi:MAG TPA: hypothetical protein VLJ10_01155 [Candidatus Bathyarchaeia archaeon]|nr:hypothetical protein [Candidatus Bathyarchaeia archaeon]